MRTVVPMWNLRSLCTFSRSNADRLLPAVRIERAGMAKYQPSKFAERVTPEMVRLLTFSLTPWRSGTEAGGDRIQEQEIDCAISDYSNAIESNPHNPTPYFARGTVHLEAFDFDSAIADLNKALELNPKSALAYCNLGWTYEAMHDERKAIAHYRKALEIDPSLEAARDNLKLLGATPERQPFYRQTKLKELKGS